MHAPEPAAPNSLPDPPGYWYKWVYDLNRYQWMVLLAAALGWLFDTMDQQLFVLARTPAISSLMPELKDNKPLLLWYSNVATAIFLFGWATGGLMFGMFSDRMGRVRTIMITVLLYSFFTGLSALSTGWADFAFYRFLTGVGVGGEFAAGVSLVAEVMPSRARVYALALLQALSAVGNITAAVISLLLPPQAEIGGLWGWRWMFLVGILPSLMVVGLLRRLREPESWYKAKEALARGQYRDEATKQLGDISELYRNDRYRYHTIIGITLATVGVIGLWGVGFWTSELIRNTVLSTYSKPEQDFYASLASIGQNLGGFFGVYSFGIMAGYLGRRSAFAVAFTLGWAAIVMVFGFMTKPEQIFWMIPILGFCTLMTFGGFAVYFPELYPTRLRSTGTGFCYNVARYLAAFAPFVLGGLTAALVSADPERAKQNLADFDLLSSLGSQDQAFRYATLLVALVYAVGLMVLPYAPETKGKPLPEDDEKDEDLTMNLTTPTWVSSRHGELHKGKDDYHWTVHLNGKSLYSVIATPAQGKYSCIVMLNASGKRVDGGKIYLTVEEALVGGLDELRVHLGW
jgi:MFS family permease